MSQFEPEPQEALARRQRRSEPRALGRLVPANGHDRGRRSFVARVLNQKLLLADLADAQLRLRMAELQPLLRAGLTVGLVADCFALASEAASRNLGQRHHPGQVEAAWCLLRGRLVQMPAGDGKTLAISLAALAAAAAGWRVQVVCASDQLARRHAAALAPLYRFFNLTVAAPDAPFANGLASAEGAPVADQPAGSIRYTCAAQLATGPDPAQRPSRRRRLVVADDADRTLQHPTVQALALHCQRMAAIGSDLAAMPAAPADGWRPKLAQVTAQRPSRRVLLPPRCLPGAPDKWQAVCQAAQDVVLRQQRPVLVATDSPESAQALSAVLRAAGLRHALLDGLPEAEQAWLLDHAGSAGRITVGSARVMTAGIDVALPGGVLNRGGLHVILAASTALPQLEQRVLGLAGRRGQPGSAQLITALDDDLFCQHATTAMRWLRLRGRPVGPLVLAVLRGLARRRARLAQAQALAQTQRQRPAQQPPAAAHAYALTQPPPTPPAQPAAG